MFQSRLCQHIYEQMIGHWVLTLEWESHRVYEPHLKKAAKENYAPANRRWRSLQRARGPLCFLSTRAFESRLLPRVSSRVSWGKKNERKLCTCS